MLRTAWSLWCHASRPPGGAPVPLPPSVVRLQVVAAVVAALLGWSWQAGCMWVQLWQQPGNFFTGTTTPMLLAADGYYFLEQTRLAAAGVAGTPLLSALTAQLHLLSGASLESIAVWLPLVAVVLLGLCYAGWGMLLGMPPCVTALAALCGALMPAWGERSHIAWFDTDPGIAVLWHACLLLLAWLCVPPLYGVRPPRAGRFALACAGGALGCALLLAWWWRPGLIVLPAALFLWGVSVPRTASRSQRVLRWGVAAGLAGAGLWCIGGPYAAWFPQWGLPPAVRGLREYALSHVFLVSGGFDELFYTSIAELSGSSLSEFLTDLGGADWAGAVVVLGTVLVCVRNPRVALFWLPSLGMGGLALVAERFQYLSVLPAAFGLACLPRYISEELGALAVRWWQAQDHRVPGDRPGRVQRAHQARGGAAGRLCGRVAGQALVLTVLINMMLYQQSTVIKPVFSSGHDALAQAARIAAAPGARLWNWWDDGYFLAARTTLPPLFDGGSQTAEAAWIAAHPLAIENERLARRWIRFFALRGAGALLPLRAAWSKDGGEPVLWQHLDAVLGAENLAAALTTLPPVPGMTPEAVAAWLLPQGQVLLYLPHRFLGLSRWWMALGMTRYPKPEDLRIHVDSFERTTFHFDPAKGQVALPQDLLDKGYKDFGGVFVTSDSPLMRPFGGGVSGPFVVTSMRSPWLYVVDELAIASVALRLLAPGGPVPGFVPVAVDFAVGGVWEVQP